MKSSISLLLNDFEQAPRQAGEIRAGEIKETRDFVPGFSSGDRTRTFLKVQDGCDYFCAFLHNSSS